MSCADTWRFRRDDSPEAIAASAGSPGIRSITGSTLSMISVMSNRRRRRVVTPWTLRCAAPPAPLRMHKRRDAGLPSRTIVDRPRAASTTTSPSAVRPAASVRNNPAAPDRTSTSVRARTPTVDSSNVSGASTGSISA